MDLNTKMDRVHMVFITVMRKFACMSDCICSWDEAHRIFSPKGCSNKRGYTRRDQPHSLEKDVSLGMSILTNLMLLPAMKNLIWNK